MSTEQTTDWDALLKGLEWAPEEIAAEEARRDQLLAVERELWEQLRSEASRTTDVALFREQLRRLMMEISEDHWCAGWLHGLEFTLWEAASCGPVTFGFAPVSAGRCLELARLAELAGGWWRWSEALKDEEFVPMSEWLAVYKERARR